MSNLIKAALLIAMTITAYTAFAQDDSTDIQQLLTPGKLDAAEMDMLQINIKTHISCLSKAEDIIGQSTDDSQGMIHGLGQTIDSAQQNLKDATKDDSLEEMRAIDAELNNFIHSKLDANITNGISECSK